MTENYELSEGQRVRLKGQGQDGPYAMAGAGSVGWVRERKLDSVGYPMVYIEWDRDHWTFNGETDMWTFEDHFEPVKEEAMSDKDKEKDLETRLRDLFLEFQAAHGDTSKASDLYHRRLKEAVEVAEEGSAFMVITLGRDYYPSVFYNYKDDKSGMLLEAQLSQLASQSHAHLVQDVLDWGEGSDDEPRWKRSENP